MSLSELFLGTLKPPSTSPLMITWSYLTSTLTMVSTSLFTLISRHLSGGTQISLCTGWLLSASSMGLRLENASRRLTIPSTLRAVLRSPLTLRELVRLARDYSTACCLRERVFNSTKLSFSIWISNPSIFTWKSSTLYRRSSSKMTSGSLTPALMKRFSSTQ